jgi:hypothetical protein
MMKLGFVVVDYKAWHHKYMAQEWSCIDTKKKRLTYLSISEINHVKALFITVATT